MSASGKPSTTWVSCSGSPRCPRGWIPNSSRAGGGLQAGEAQLLAFTRIFLRDPGLVILDEATSRLDPATEYLIEQAVDKLVRNRSAIIVAHRLGTVQRADDILILEDGRVVEYGERVRLAEDPTSRFYHLLQTGHGGGASMSEAATSTPQKPKKKAAHGILALLLANDPLFALDLSRS